MIDTLFREEMVEKWNNVLTNTLGVQPFYHVLSSNISKEIVIYVPWEKKKRLEHDLQMVVSTQLHIYVAL